MSPPASTRGSIFMYEGRDFYPMPVVDLNGLEDSDPVVRASIVRELHEAGKVGAFCVVNHGIDRSLLDRMRAVGKDFFALDSEEKAKSAKVKGYHLRPVGYHAEFQDLTQKAFIVQRREVFEYQAHPQQNQHHVPWPEAVPALKECIEAYSVRHMKLTKWVLEALAEGLGVGRSALLEQIGEPHQRIVAASYPTVATQSLMAKIHPSSIGFGAHSDLPCCIVVLEDNTGGLQVWHDGEWRFPQPILEGLIFFLGDPIECMSNGVYHSPVHRVLAPTNTPRFSCITTFEPASMESATFRPVPDLVQRSGGAAMYAPYNYGERLSSLLHRRFDPEIMTKKFMVTDPSVIEESRNFSFKDGVFHIGDSPLGSASEGY